MNAELEMVSIGEAAEVKSGFAFKSDDYRNEGLRLVRIGNLNGNGLEFSNETVCVPEKYEKTYAEFLLCKGDVLIAMSGATTGKLAFVKEQDLPCILNQRVGRFSVNPILLDSKYLFSYLSQESVRRKILSDAGGSAQPNVSPSQLKELKIPLPPLPIQKRIATILEKADAAREKRRQTIELTDKFLQSVFLEMFGDPVKGPKRYEIKTLNEVCSKITDGTHKTPTYVDSGIPFLRITDIGSQNIDWENVKKITKAEYLEITKRCKPEKGDVLFSKNGTIGIVKEITWDLDFATFVSLALLKPKIDVISSTYLAEFLRTPIAIGQATERSKTGTVTNLHLEEIREIKIPLPPLSLQQKFAALVEQVEAMRTKQRASEQELENLFQSLMQRAFKGELVS